LNEELDRSQFFVRLPEPRNALLAHVVVQMVCKAEDVGAPEPSARHKVGRAFEDYPDFLGKFPFLLFASH
jgi:hypothetical protein